MAQMETSSGIQISYDDRKQEIIQRNLSVLMKSVRAGNLFVGFQVSQPLHVLGEYIHIKDIEDDTVKRHVIFTAAIQLQSLTTPRVRDWAEAIGVAAQNYLNRPMQLYHVMLPLNVEERSLTEVEKFSIQGVDLVRETWANFQNVYAHNKLIEDIRDYFKDDMLDDLWNWSGVPLVARVTARNPAEAFGKAFEPYDVLRAIFNFVHDASPFQFQRPEPLASVIPPVGYGVFLPDGTFSEAFVDAKHLPFQRRVLSPANLKDVLDLLATLFPDGKLTGTKKIYIEALHAYNRGLDATNWQDAYLSLWQALEIMTTFDLGKKHSMKAMVERTKILLKTDEVTHDFLNVCADRRNALVHRGQFSEDGQSEVLLLKVIVRYCLGRLLQLIRDFPTHARLSEFFLHAHLAPDQLNERKQVIEVILADNERTKNKT